MLSFFNQIRRWTLGVSAFSFLFIISQADAGNYFSSCCPTFCDWDISVEADYLYWKPCTNDLKYVSETVGEEDSGQTALLEIRGVCPDWESGYRVKFEAFQTCGSAFGFVASFTHIDADKGDRVVGDDNLLPTFTHPLYNQILQSDTEESLEFKEALANWESEYNQWDVGIAYHFQWQGCHLLTPFLGIGGVHFDEHFNTLYLVTDDVELDDIATFSVSDLEITGVGLKIGMDYRYSICKGLEVFTFANGTVLVSDTENSVKFGTVESDGSIAVEFPNLKFVEKDCCTFIPGFHLGVGIGYTGCLCGYELWTNVSYEFTSWHHIPDPRLFVQGGDGFGELQNLSNIAVSGIYQSRAISYHGLSVGVGVTF